MGLQPILVSHIVGAAGAYGLYLADLEGLLGDFFSDGVNTEFAQLAVVSSTALCIGALHTMHVALFVLAMSFVHTLTQILWTNERSVQRTWVRLSTPQGRSTTCIGRTTCSTKATSTPLSITKFNVPTPTLLKLLL